MASKKISFTENLNSTSNLEFGNVFSFENKKSENKTTFEIVKTESINLDPKGEFQELFPINEDDLNNISESMSKYGFKKPQALHLIFIEEENVEFLGDGHTRLMAAKIAGITEVPVIRETYETRNIAKIAMLELQVHRRQLSDADKFKTIKLIRELRGEKKATNGEGKTSAILAKETGMSTRQVEKNLAILNSGNQEIIQAVENGELSTNAAHNIVCPPKKKEPRTNYTNDISTHLDSLESNEGNPAPVTCHTEHPREDPYKLTSEQDSERTAERKEAYEHGFEEGKLKGIQEGFEKAIIFMAYELKHGKQIDEVLSDERISDFSYSSISKIDFSQAEDDFYGA